MKAGGKRGPSRATPRKTPTLFVYGSLMHKKYWRHALGAREAAAVRLTPARLRGWRRWWNGRRPSYGAAVLNMKRAEGHEMWGAVVRGLSEDAWARLDAQERSHLPRARVLVVTTGGRRLWAYCYRQRGAGPERRPAADYVRAVRGGAKALGSAVARDVEADVARLEATLRSPRRRRA